MPSIKDILSNNNFAQVVADLCTDTIENRESREYLDEYNGERLRRETSVGHREPKMASIYSDDELDDKGNPVKVGEKPVAVAKIITNIPKKIVRTAAAFMFGGEMTITADNTDDNSLEDFKKVFERKLKMKSILMKFTRTVLSETKSAIVFYPVVKDGNAELKVKILSLPKDDNIEYEFYPHFDDDDDMDGFIHKYATVVNGNNVECVKIYTAEKVISATKASGEWTIKEDKNLFGKIPVVYAEVDRPEWEDVANLIDYYEMRLSRMADTNDYFGDPMLKTYGLANLPSKETVGKELNFTMEVDPDTGTAYHGDADYLAWQQSIDSQKEEISNLRHEIFAGVSYPDLSFDNLTGIGDVSGVAREFMTVDAKIKTAEQMETFGPVVQRCISITQSGMAKISHIKNAKAIEDNFFDVEFGSILPRNIKEELENLSLATGGKAFNSQETIVERSPYTGNAKDEISKIKAEAAEDAKANNPLGQIVE